MSAAWLPRGIGRIGFVALALIGSYFAGCWLAGDISRFHAAAADPVVGRTLDLSATTPLPGRVGPPPAVPHPAKRHLVNLFASWCLPCRIEAPVLAALAARGVRIDGVAVRDDPGSVTRFLRRHGDPFVGVRLDPRGRVQAGLGVAGLPETYVVDAAGVIRYRHRGVLRPDELTMLAGRLGSADHR